MRVTVDTASPIPAYEQIRAQVTALADNGVLPAGTRLPPIRQLAADLGLAPGTVAKAYALLEKAGVASTHRRRGTLITDRGVLEPAQQLSELRRAAAAFARSARLLDIDRTTAQEAIDAALDT
jgi:DNA-binding transcriptional regulator YhcF (GntR family)